MFIGGTQVLTIIKYTIIQLDPTTLTAGTSTSAPLTCFYYLRNIAYANNLDAMVTTGLNGSGYTSAYRYSARNPGLSAFGTGTIFNSDPGASPGMAISPNGGTLFIAGASGIVVIPAP